MKKKIVIGIDASNISLGGGFTHLFEILKNNPYANVKNIQIYIWANDKVLNRLPSYSNITKKHSFWLNRGYLFRLIWMLTLINFKWYNKSDIIFHPGGLSLFSHPNVTMFRNMLIVDDIEQERYKWFSKDFIRLKILKLLTFYSFKNCDGLIFLSKHALTVINEKMPRIETKKKSIIINHGVSEKFKPVLKSLREDSSINIVYVSTIDIYKHHILVMDEVNKLFPKHNIKLHLVGGITSQLKDLFFQTVNKYSNFVTYHGLLNYEEIQNIYKKTDIFIYASTCENMPNILIEAMASGLCIVCSHSSPMPEFLNDGGIYFDPFKEGDLSSNLENLIGNPGLRITLAKRAIVLSKNYNWKICSKTTFDFLISNSEKFHSYT